jgi:capsular exopolysaccharide synthesis family protein
MSEFTKILQQAAADRAIKTETQIQTETRRGEDKRPVEDVVPLIADRTKSLDGVEGHLVSLLYPASVLAEPYRMVRHRIEHLHRTAQLSIVAVSSAMVAEGKTTTAINLAGALAQGADARVLLVDADLRNPSIMRHLALGDVGSRGLVDAILDPKLGLDDVVSRRPPFNLDVLPAGTVRPAPYEVLKSPRLGDLLEEARRRYDYVVLDTAPLVAVPDSRLIGKWVDGFLVVVAAHKTPRKLVGETLDLVEPTQLVALLCNGDDRPLSGYSYPASRTAHSRSLWRRSKSTLTTRRAGRI